MAGQVSEKQLVERLRELLLTLPYDLKALLQVLSDADLPAPARELAAGSIVYCLTPHDSIPDPQGVFGYVECAVLLRVSLNRILELSGEDAADYRERFPEQFGVAATDGTLLHDYLGDSLAWIDSRLPRLKDQKYKGKRIVDYVTQEESTLRLYEDVNDFATAYEIDDRSVERVSSGKVILDLFRKRCDADTTRRG